MDCPNCGCKIYNGHCVNCHEGTYIFEQYQEIDDDEFDEALSDEFVNKIIEQEREAKEIRERMKEDKLNVKGD
jgi:hypothetical protein